MMKKYAVLSFIIVLMFAFAGCGGADEPSSQSSESEIQSLAHMVIMDISEENGQVILNAAESEESDDIIPLNMDGQENLAKALERYKGWFYLSAEYGETLTDYTVFDIYTDEELGKLDEEGLYNAFDPERFDVEKAAYEGEIKLSELKENVTYEFKRDSDSEEILITNDTGSSVIVCGEDAEYRQTMRMRLFARNYDDSLQSSMFFNALGKKCTLRYESVEADELMKGLSSENVIRLSGVKSGDTVSVQFEGCIQNDTNETAVIIDQDGREISIAAGEVIGLCAEWGTEFTVQ